MITTAIATAIVRTHIDGHLSVTEVRELAGGMIDRVLEFVTDGQPASIVAKVHDNAELSQVARTIARDTPHDGYRTEQESLTYFREHTDFPVPRPLARVENDCGLNGCCLLLEKVAGRRLGRARMTRAGTRRFQQELARHVGNLHEHRRNTYGRAGREGGFTDWRRNMADKLEDMLSEVAEGLSPPSRRTIEKLIVDLDQWLPEFGDPRLVHGDLWAGNIMVDDTDPDRPRITAFLDGVGRFSEVELELAYLRVFDTADATFFEHYERLHPLRDGFDRRCRVYWLHTMMVHLWLFGTKYLPACEDLAAQIEAME